MVEVAAEPDGTTVQLDALRVRVYHQATGGGQGGGGGEVHLWRFRPLAEQKYSEWPGAYRAGKSTTVGYVPTFLRRIDRDLTIS